MLSHLSKLSLFLFLLVATASLTAEEEYWEYTFRPGDSIWNIAKKYTNSVNNWVKLQKINEKFTGPDRRIPPGTRIIIPVSMLKLQPTPAIVIAVQGDIDVVRANGKQEAIKVGTKLYSGDALTTQSSESLRMRFADKSELQVLADSEVVLDKLSYHEKNGMVDTHIRLNHGTVNTWVEKLTPESNYKIKTPSAVTAVRGTAFRMASEADTSRTEVTEGIVGVAAGQSEKNVKQGFGIVAVKDQPLPEPVKLLPAPQIGDNQQADNASLKVAWKSMDDAAFYRYQLSTDNRFDQLVSDAVLDTNQLHLTDLSPGKYYLRVRGVDHNKLQGLDAVREYDIVTPPPPPQVDEDYWQIFVVLGIILISI